MSAKMEATVLANNMTDAQAALQLHQERKAEIDGRQTNFMVTYPYLSRRNLWIRLYIFFLDLEPFISPNYHFEFDGNVTSLSFSWIISIIVFFFF